MINVIWLVLISVGILYGLFTNNLEILNNTIVDKTFFYYLIPNILLILFSIICATPIVKNILDRYKYIRIIVLVFGMILSVAFLVDASFNPFLYFRF